MLPQITFSWSGYAHTSMTNSALVILVRMFNQDFNKTFLNELEFSISEPDQNRVIDHTNILQCASMINSLANKSERMLHKNEDLQKIMFTMAQATHYIEDLNNPQHCSDMKKGITKILKEYRLKDIGLIRATTGSITSKTIRYLQKIRAVLAGDI